LFLSYSVAMANRGARLSQVDADTSSVRRAWTPIDAVIDRALLDRRAGPVGRFQYRIARLLEVWPTSIGTIVLHGGWTLRP
jgi:hypothetical protein